MVRGCFYQEYHTMTNQVVIHEYPYPLLYFLFLLGDFPFTIVRRQFPIRPAFCITINKGQGQSNQRVGIYLPKPVFGHGQLYTGFSRGRRKRDVHVLIAHDDDEGEGFTDNIVYPEVLTNKRIK